LGAEGGAVLQNLQEDRIGEVGVAGQVGAVVGVFQLRVGEAGQIPEGSGEVGHRWRCA